MFDWHVELGILCSFLDLTEKEVLSKIETRHDDLKKTWKELKTPVDYLRFYSETDFYIYDSFSAHSGKYIYSLAEADNKLAERIKLLGVKNVLDWGTGSGYLLTQIGDIIDKDATVIGTDVPGQTYAFAYYRLQTLIEMGKNINVNLIKLDVENYKEQFEDRSYDVITCCDVIEHLPTWEDGIELLKWFKTKAPITLSNISFGRQFQLHPMHLEKPTDDVMNNIKKLYSEAYC